MANCSGKSLIPIMIPAFQQFVNSVIPKDKLQDFEIKLDGRAKVKSVFVKLDGNVLTLYTGAIVGLGDQKFPEIESALALLILFTIFGIKKAGQGEDFEVKSTDAGIQDIKSDAAFQLLSGNLGRFLACFTELNDKMLEMPEPVVTQVETFEQSPVQTETSVTSVTPTVKPVKEKKSKSSNDSPFKGVPLENTPELEMPLDLDLKMV